ncbi:hypothetical protein [Aminobacter aminovorans]|uniref:hypothetical protein n=1 Tax=Aminobacter aminovorans TaxID=83263 RepID=UPI00285FA563|nr:hypothetical protein [Aminobacter aminovorans]MDR7225385.1 hypothetical protein [Aminobacter aminovorans]
MTIDEIKDEIEQLFSPGPDAGDIARRGLRQPRLMNKHGLNLSYLETHDWEGSSGHKHTRLHDSEEIDTLTRNSDMPERLMFSALQLLADSIMTYADSKKREGEIRYYPPIILTFWSGFESFVRYASELLIVTVPNVPPPVRLFLREIENTVDASGKIGTRTKHQSVLDRYSVFLASAYGLKVDRGSRFWQGLVEAKALRDSYTHVNMKRPRAITTGDVLEFIERTLLGLIWPSASMGRTIMLQQYFLYDIWAGLRELAKEYRERPFFLDWHLKEPSLFHCNFDGVNEDLYPSVRSDRYLDIFSERVEAYKGRQQSNDKG